ncbi:MAG: hypothetical protein FD165_2831, partial [Gammaproteobacteria bacterium]
TLLGTAARNGTGNAKANIITGNAGKNVLAGGGGKDRLVGGSGNDTLIYDPLDVKVDGGLHTDLLRVLGTGINVDLTTIAVIYAGIEAIDITGTGDNTLVLSPTKILALSTTSNTVRVAGNTGDIITVTDGWVQGADVVFLTQTYAQYIRGTAKLLVDLDIDRSTINMAPTSADFAAAATEDTLFNFTSTDFAFTDDVNGFAGVRIDALPAAGSLTLGGAEVIAGQIIDVADLDMLEFTPALNASGDAYTVFTFSVKDDAEGFSVAPNTVTVNVTAVNDSPVIAVNTGATVDEDSFVTITAAKLNEGDPDNSGAELVYTVDAGPTNGFLHFIGFPDDPITTFTQDDINANRVRYQHANTDDTIISDGFDFSLADDGLDGSTAATGTFLISISPVDDLLVNDPPVVLTNKGLTVTDGDMGTITVALLNEGDPDDGSDMIYTVTTAPSNGTLRRDGVALSDGDPFTQLDINQNRITYLHNGDATSTDNFTFELADGGENG